MAMEMELHLFTRSNRSGSRHIAYRTSIDDLFVRLARLIGT